MKPTLACSDPGVDRVVGVVARVVAWHNRHPLAARITAAHVHGVGVVGLPYATSSVCARVSPGDPPTTPDRPESAAAVGERIEPAFGDGDTAATDVIAGHAASILARALPETATQTDALAADLPPPPRAWHPLAWWRRWRGRAAFHALFSEDFVAPLRPRQVASWVASHGVSQCLLDADAPRRRIDVDTLRRRPGDTAPEVELQVLTAAIDLGDSRKRLLLAAGEHGAIIGPRHWSRPRLAATASTTCAVMALAIGAAVWRPAPAPGPEPEAARAGPAAAITTASTSASATTSVTALASASIATSAPVIAPALPASAAAKSVPTPAPTAAASRPPAASAVAAVATVTAEPELPRPESVRPRRGRIELQALVPPLADDERHTLRLAGRDMRKTPVAKAWALVTRPLTNKRQSELVTAQLKAVALLQPLPMRAELLQGSDGLRAVFWPFPTAKDAEKVRLALADKGLRTEVLEF